MDNLRRATTAQPLPQDMTSSELNVSPDRHLRSLVQTAPNRISRPVLLVAAALMLQMAILLFASNSGDTLTYDEPFHIGGAAGYVYDHDVSWNWEHPPLVKWLSGISLWLGGTVVSFDSAGYKAHSDLDFGRSIIYGEGNNPARVQLLARLPIMMLTLCFGAVIFAFARDLWGDFGALLSLGVYSFTPDILAHGRLVTTDVAVSGFLTVTMWMLWRARVRGISYLYPASIAMGLALSTKFTSLAFAPVFVILVVAAVIPALNGRPIWQKWLRCSAMTIGAGAVALAVLWASYLIIDPGLNYDKPSHPAGIAASGLLADVANIMPVPGPYREGLRFAIGAEAGRPAFLLGERYIGGRPLFYPMGLLVKTPLGTLALLIVGTVVALARRRRDICLYIAFPIAVWMAMAMTSHINIGVRHVMPVVVLSTVLAGGAAAVVAPSRLRRSAPVGAAALVAISSWTAFPNYLSYSNEVFGGVDHTYRVLADSNVDWGQDVERFAAWLRDHPHEGPVYFNYFGTVQLAAHTLKTEPMPPVGDLLELTSGRIAISASAYSTYMDSPGQYDILGSPDYVVGGSILVWDLPLRPER